MLLDLFPNLCKNCHVKNKRERLDSMLNIITETINPEFKKLVARSFNVAGFIDNIKREWNIENYNNGAKIFEWILRYENIHKIEDYIDSIKSYTITSGGWNLPLLIDSNSKIAFIFMKEANLNQKRKELNSPNTKYQNSQTWRPPHYVVRLSKLNKDIANQLTLEIEENQTAYEILKSICPEIDENYVPEDLKLMTVTFKSMGDELVKITGGFYDKNLMEIYTEDWSQYITNDYSTLLDTRFNKDKVDEINNKIADIENSKDDLTEFIGDEDEQNNKNEENK